MKVRKKIFFIISSMFIIVNSIVYSQQDQIPVRDDQSNKPIMEIPHKLDLGIGYGLDYGGLLGAQIGYSPVKHLTVFGAGGYYMVGFGWQLGIKGLFIPKTNKHVVRPFLEAMYGANSAIWVVDFEDYNAIYLGFTVSGGAEFRFGKKKANGFNICLNVPLRTPDYWDDYNRMKQDPRIEIIQDVLPVAFSVGYHHEF